MHFSSNMANPRKFSEKIALHNQKQAEETAAFEAVLRDVNQATRGHMQNIQNQQLYIQQLSIMQQYRGGSLPNVNQMVDTKVRLDGLPVVLTLQQMAAMHRGQQSHIEQMHPHDRVTQQIGPLRSRPFQMEKSRADCSPYGSRAYLSPPPDTSWRRTNSDSAIHSSSLEVMDVDISSPETPPMHRRIQEVVGENADLPAGTCPWDPIKLQQRPKSCEVPNINLYPSTEQDSQPHMAVTTNTGSLPDLSMYQFSSLLSTPTDIEEQQQYDHGQSNLLPGAHQMGPVQIHNGLPAQSPSSQQRGTNGPSPLVLPGTGNQAVDVPLSSPVSDPDNTTIRMDPHMWQQYVLYVQQQQLAVAISDQQGYCSSPMHSSHNIQGLSETLQGCPSHFGLVPKVYVTSHENGQPEHQVSVGNDISVNSGLVISSASSVLNSQGNSQDLCARPDYNQQQLYFDGGSSQYQGIDSQQNALNSTSCNNKIPDILLTGMMGGSFDTDFFNEVSDEVLKDGLVPLDFDSLQMLTEPGLVADADTETLFRFDQL